MNQRRLLFVIGTIWLLSSTGSIDAQTAVCGNGIREGAEQCDDGNTTNLDGCSSQCKFEQNQRINQLKYQFTTDTYCTQNAFGGAIVNGTVQSQMQTSLDAAIKSGATSVIFAMLGLDDLAGTTDPSVQLGMLNGTPVTAPNSVTYDGTSDVDWWYAVDPGSIDAMRAPTTLLPGSIASYVLTAGPAEATLSLDFAGTQRPLDMLALHLRAAIGPTNKPLTSTGTTPGHIASEHLDPVLVSYANSGAGITAEFCGNITASSLAAIPVPTAIVGCSLTNCTRCYTATNSMLDLFVGGCTIVFAQQIRPTQPDQSRNGVAYAFSTNVSHVVNACTANGIAASLPTCLTNAAYSSFFKFSTDRVIAGCPVPSSTVASNNGPICAGQTVQLTATGSSGTFSWTGPGGFTSALQNPTIPNATTAASGTDNVTVTAGCGTSPAGTTTVVVNAIPATPVITAPASVPAGATGLTASVVSHPGSSYAWTITNGTITAGQSANQVTFTAGLSGSVGLGVVETIAGCPSPQAPYSIPIITTPFGPPPGLTATATSTTTVNVIWLPVSGADHYEIFSRSNSSPFAIRGMSTTSQFSDSGLLSATTYLYEVRAVNASAAKSSFSNTDPATTVMFTDDPVIAGSTAVKAIHLAELRQAVNAMRATAGLPLATFTDSIGASTIIQAVHMNELRSALTDARTAFGLSSGYTDVPVAAGSTAIKAIHVQEIRDGVK